jgi:uncharacterized protein with PIN domain
MNCKHHNTQIELMPEIHEHYAKEVCNDCNTFIRWVSKQEIEELNLSVIVPPKFKKLF